MGDFKHLVIAKFKEGVEADKVLEEMKTMVSKIGTVKSFEWGHDSETSEHGTQGFTHAFLMTFHKKDDYTAFQSHAEHAQFSGTFLAAIDNVVVLDFPAVVEKPEAAA